MKGRELLLAGAIVVGVFSIALVPVPTLTRLAYMALGLPVAMMFSSKGRIFAPLGTGIAVIGSAWISTLARGSMGAVQAWWEPMLMCAISIGLWYCVVVLVKQSVVNRPKSPRRRQEVE